jgi:hypothetical protein
MTETTPLEAQLPAHILAKADFQHGEYAWRIKDIPEVVKAAADMNLLNLGGQLQVRIPGCIGECDWVDADPAAMVPPDLPWEVRVRMAAELSHQEMADLQQHFDFHQQIREAFPAHVEPYLASGGKIEDATWFVWYVMDEAGDAEHQASLTEE